MTRMTMMTLLEMTMEMLLKIMIHILLIQSPRTCVTYPALEMLNARMTPNVPGVTTMSVEIPTLKSPGPSVAPGVSMTVDVLKTRNAANVLTVDVYHQIS